MSFDDAYHPAATGLQMQIADLGRVIASLDAVAGRTGSGQSERIQIALCHVQHGLDLLRDIGPLET